MVLGTVTWSLSFWTVFNAIEDARSSNSLYDSAQICSAVTLLGSFQSDFWQPWLSKKDPVQQPSLSVQVRFCWPWLSCTVSIIGHHPDQEVVHSCGYLCMIKCQCLSRRSRVSCRPVFFFWGGRLLPLGYSPQSPSTPPQKVKSCRKPWGGSVKLLLGHNRGLTGLGGPPWKCLAFQQMSLHTFLGEHCNTLLQPVVLWEYLMFLSATLFLLILKH